MIASFRLRVRHLSALLGAVLCLAAPALAQPRGAAPPAERPWLGISLEPVTDASDPDAPPGVVVSGVFRDSAADQAGLRTGDVITAIDGQAVESTQQVIAAIQRRDIGAWIQVEFVRRGSKRTTTARLVPAPASPSWDDLRQGWAGVELVDVPQQLREFWGGSEEAGVLVGEVNEGGPADAAGLRPGDLVLAIDGREVADATELFVRLRRAGDGNTVELEVSRQGAFMTLDVTLTAEPPRTGEAGRERARPRRGGRP